MLHCSERPCADDIGHASSVHTPQEQTMTYLLTNLQQGLQKRAAYHRTLAELRRMPLDVAIDLDIDPMQAPKLAAQAVYGPRSQHEN
jgi:hypothetical protein